MSETTDALLASALATFFRVEVVLVVLLDLLTAVALVRRRVSPEASSASAPELAARSPGRADALPQLAVLRCAACGAPVPLALSSLRCDHCGAAVHPPEDYVETLTLRDRAARQLRTAVRQWRWLRVWVSPPVTLLLVPLALAWLVASTLGAAVGAPTEGSLAIGVGFVLGAFGMFALFALRGFALDARARIPTLPKGVDARLGHAETKPCDGCGAPARFGASDFAATCGYCGAETYRVRLARAARQAAKKAESDASVSVRAAMLEVRARFRGVLQTMQVGSGLATFVLVVAWIASFLDAC